LNQVKAIELNEAQSRLNELFEDAQAGSPVLLVRGGQVAKLERLEPPEFGGDLASLEKMLEEAVAGPHAEWTPQDLEDIARRVRENRGA
jgi:antitoxin (DNA-binding transcriptional repressor) of toxin-antitoxin stability system